MTSSTHESQPPRRLIKRVQAQERDAWFSVEAEWVLAHYQSSSATGLSEKAALRNLHYDPNLSPESIHE